MGCEREVMKNREKNGDSDREREKERERYQRRVDEHTGKNLL